MRETHTVRHSTLGFAEQMTRESGEAIHRCYQCRKCAAGCPVIQEMDRPPNALLRLVQLGLKEEALSCSTIWLCAGCLTCSTRCPNDIDIARVMDALRERALAEGIHPPEREISSFHTVFLASVRHRGRVHEAGMLAALKLKTGHLFQDMGLGWDLFWRGKMSVLPKGIGKAARQEVRRIFDCSMGEKTPGGSCAEAGEDTGTSARGRKRFLPHAPLPPRPHASRSPGGEDE